MTNTKLLTLSIFGGSFLIGGCVAVVINLVIQPEYSVYFPWIIGFNVFACFAMFFVVLNAILSNSRGWK